MASSFLSKVRLKYIILALVLLVTCACLAWFAMHWVRGYRKTARLQAALSAAEGPDRELARKLLQGCLFEDRNNEKITVKLAELLERDGHWSYAAMLWQRAVGLNEFEASYPVRELRALLLSRSMGTLQRRLQEFQSAPGAAGQQAPEIQLYSVYTQWLNGDIEGALRQFDALDAETRSSAPFGAFLEVLLRQGNDKIEEFTTSSDPVTAFEAQYLLGCQALTAEKHEETDNWLLQAAQFNPELVYPVLGLSYFQRPDYERAIDAYQKALEYRRNPEIAMRLGELLALSGRLDELKALSQNYRSGNKAFLQAGYYLDALQAYCASDDQALAANLKPLQGLIESPVFMMLSLHSAVRNDQPEEIQRIIRQLRASPAYSGLYPEARQQTLDFILEVLLPASRSNEAATLGVAISDPQKPELPLTRVQLAVHIADNSVTQQEIAAALQAFPADPVILQLAGAAALQSGQYEAAIRLTEACIKNGSDTLTAHLQLYRAYRTLERLDDASREMALLQQRWPEDPTVLLYVLAEAVANNQPAQLDELAQRLSSVPEASSFNLRLAALARVEAARLREDTARVATALSQLAEAEKNYEPTLAPDWPSTLPVEVSYAFRSAFLLAEADIIEPAIMVYRRIQNHLANRGLVLLNLSELYAANKQSAEALNAAKEAWNAAPSWAAAQECYGIRLTEAGQDDTALQLLSPLVGANASDRIKTAWFGAMEREIARRYQAKNVEVCRNLCDQLRQQGDPDGVAKDYMAKLEADAGK